MIIPVAFPPLRILQRPPRVTVPSTPSPQAPSPRVTVPSTPSPQDPPPLPRRPALIEPNNDDPVDRRSGLRSRPVYAPGTRSRYVYAAQQLCSAVSHPAHQSNSVINKVSGRALEYRHLSTGPNQALWIKSLANDLGRLAQ